MIVVNISSDLECELFRLFLADPNHPPHRGYGYWLKNNIQGFSNNLSEKPNSLYDQVVYTSLHFDTEENANLFKMKYMT